MRTTLTLDGQLVEEAQRLTGIEGTSAVVRAGLEALIARETSRRWAALGGSDPSAEAARRRRAS